ncbi:acyltransferase family protein [Planctomonas deserti]|uniref:acyltransferase family protein n=1 Tax=Planctomonas deserti TaxID=2144185 RepID=UPI00131F1A75|nr:acyltransferase family protein [Planctomonas deserti]
MPKSLFVKPDPKVRLEVQALRAFAVIAVVLYHLWPRQVEGGYVGVDVFFVISGFLITSHLVRRLEGRSGLSLREFYLRRALRLLPASMLVLVVVAIVTIVAVPQTLWSSSGAQLIASSFYVQNWLLAALSTNYLTTGIDGSLVQHFWSLSVEEQFYLVWPLLLIAATYRAARGRDRRRNLAICMASVFALSLAYSVYETSRDPSVAYFVTPTRMWEFAAGGLLALFAPSATRGRAALKALLAWVGLLGIAVSVVTFTGNTPFPGYAALLPVLSTALVIYAGAPDSRWSPSWIYRLRPVQFTGDISYSLYLWHWPIIILLPVLIHGSVAGLTIPLKLAAATLAFLVAWLSKRYVEDRFRDGLRRSPGVRPRRALIGIAAAMVVVLATGSAITTSVTQRMSDAEASLVSFASSSDCFGAASFVRSCGDGQEIHPDPVIAATNVVAQGCQQRASLPEPLECTHGARSPGALKVAVVGDSHANQWMPAILEIAKDDDWSVSTYFKSVCPLNAVPQGHWSCAAWVEAVRDRLQGEFDVVIVSALSSTDFAGGTEEAVAGYVEAWRLLQEAGAHVIVLGDTPSPSSAGIVAPPECVELRGASACAFERDLAMADDPLAEAARRSGATFIDSTRLLCPGDECQTVIGQVLVYRDANHLTGLYVTSLAPMLGEEIRRAIESPSRA